MILSFNSRFIWPLLDATKIHTLRRDPHNRWKKGRTIHFATGVRTKKYMCFEKGICTGIQICQIKYIKSYITITVDGKKLSDSETSQLARNDGFESIDDFANWFTHNQTLKIIHWTDFRY